MIRKRLRMIVYMAMAVVLALGACIIWLTVSHHQQYQRLIDVELASIQAAGNIDMNANAAEHGLLRASILGIESYPQNKAKIDIALKGLARAIDRIALNAKTPNENEIVAELNVLAKELKQFHGNRSLLDIREGDERVDEITRLSTLVSELSRSAREIENINLERIDVQRGKFSKRIKSAAIYASAMTILALLILYAMYAIFSKLTIEPIIEFTGLIKEVRKRNFDLNIENARSDELGALFQAFNEMASELQVFNRESDDKIIELNERNRILLSSFPNAVIVTDSKGRIVQKNPSADQILDEVRDKAVLTGKLSTLFRRVLSKGEDLLHTELEDALLIRIDDQEAYFLPRVFKLPKSPASPETQLWVLMLSDVTRIRWLDDVKMNTLGTVSHEVKTPLTSIRMMLHLLLEQKKDKLSELQLEMVQSASRECERLVGVLDHMLNVSKLSSGAKNLQVRPSEPLLFFSEIPKSLEMEAKDKDVTIQVDCSPQLPAVMADRERIRQVVNNFLSNALKYSPRESMVVLKAFKRGADYVRFKVIDQGPGIPLESQEHIFEKFYRADEQRLPGTGLGLSIARQIISAHGGNIGFKSPEEGPTIFYFELPIARIT